MALAVGGPALASSDPTMTSSSYSVRESEVGGIGDFNESSSNYSLKPGVDDGGATLGEAATGNSGSTSYQTNSGFNTTAQPGLSLVINTSSVNLGVLSSAAKSTGTATFDVSDYTSYGYIVQIYGSTPQISGHNLTALTTDTASSAGTEQFGINTVKNTVAGVGDDPLQVADNVYSGSNFAYGVAGDGVHNYYAQSDKWRYNSGEVIASAPKTSGDTRYTITFLANISNLTPGGGYNGALNIVATGTY